MYENVITIQHLVIISDNITSIYSIMRCRNIFMNVLCISTLTNDKRGLRAISCYALSLITKLWKFANGRFNASFISSIIKIHLSCCKRLYYVYVYICTTSKLFKFIQILSHICKFSNPKFATMMEPHIVQISRVSLFLYSLFSVSKSFQRDNTVFLIQLYPCYNYLLDHFYLNIFYSNYILN